jgi:hypothetical protein
VKSKPNENGFRGTVPRNPLHLQMSQLGSSHITRRETLDAQILDRRNKNISSFFSAIPE